MNKQIFEIMDVDGDGCLTKDEIKKGYRKYISHLGGVVSNDYVNELFDEADCDK
jgi:Ca2+-binding EF-hand superfamily protein